jgi:hypothetical protein
MYLSKKLRAAAEGASMVLSGAATPYECCGLFDLCTDADLMSLSYQGADPFLDWITWRADLNCIIRKSFISYVAPAGTAAGSRASGLMPNPCADPNGVEFGKCEFGLRDFGRIGFEGPVRDLTTNKEMYCNTQPMYRLDGTLISDTREFDMLIATAAVIQELRGEIITGTVGSGGFAGFQALLDSSYHDPEGNPCPLMNSNVINWGGNAMDGGAGITWNGQAVGASYDLVDVLLAVYRRIRTRLGWSPLLSGNLTPGDMVLVMPSFLVQCLLNFYTCWSVCDSAVIATPADRLFRDNLNGGMFGAGAITLDGFKIPIIAYDWNTIAGPQTGDIYFLTGSVGATRLIEGQYLPMQNAAANMVGANASATDGGRLLTWADRVNMCYQQKVVMRPRLLLWAPWAEAVINDVRCAGPGGPLSPDPAETSYFPGGGSLNPASCPPVDVLQAV